MQIVVGDPASAKTAAFLTEHLDEMRAVTPPGSVHALGVDELRAPDVLFWSATDGDEVVGCGALKRLDAEHAELKAMRTTRARQRTGVASTLLTHIVAEAKRLGYTRLSLETGSTESFLPARRLYEKFGFEYCEPFADYRPDPHSAFMTKLL